MPSSIPADVLASIADGQYSTSYTPPAGYQPLSNLSSATLSSVATPLGAISANIYMGPNNQFVIAFEGTNSSSSIFGAQIYADRQILDGVSGTQIAPLSQASAYLAAVVQAISDQYPDATFTITGHSLGGSEADYAVEQLEGGTQPLISSTQINVVSFDAAALSDSTIGAGTTDIDALNIASYADPVTAGTLANGFVFPGSSSSNVSYINTGVDPSTITNLIGSAENELLGDAIGATDDGIILLMNNAGSTDALENYLIQGHSMDQLQAAIDAQSEASASGQNMTVGQLQGSSSLTPLVAQIEANPQTQQTTALASAINNWLLSNGLGSSAAGADTIESDLGGQDLTGAEVISSPDGLVVLLADGDAYGLDPDGGVSTMTSSTSSSGAVTLSIVNADGSTTTEVTNSDGGATVTEADASGDPVGIATLDASGDITTYDQYNPDGSQDFLVYNSAGEATSDTQYSADGAVVEQQQFAYDSSGDLLSITTDDGAGALVSFQAYDADGSSTLYDYNASGQPVEEINYASDGVSVTSSETLAYDSSGDLSSTTTYDGSGDLVSVDDYLPDGGQALSQYDSAGDLSTITTTDSSGRLVSLDTYASDGSHLLQDYDASGQLTSQTQYAADGTSVVTVQSYAYDSSGALASIDTSDGAGDLLSTDIYNSDGSHVLTTYDADGSDTVENFDAAGDLTMTQAFDADGDLVSANGVSALGVAWTETIDATGAVSFTYGLQSVDYADAAVDVAGALGSALGKALGGDSLVAQIGYGTVLGTTSKVLASELADGSLPAVSSSANDAFGAAIGDDLDSALNQSFGSFGVVMSQEFQTVGVNGLAALLMLELANSLGLKGFDAGLFDAAGTTITSALVTNVLGAVTAGASDPGDIGDALFADFDTAQFIGTLETSVTGFFGSYLAAQLVTPTNEDGAIGSNVGSAVGSALGALLLGPLGAFLGSFLGDILGTVIGDLFGGSPEANAQVAINGSGEAALGDVSTKNGGDPTLVSSLATSTANTVDGLLAQTGAAVTAIVGSTTQFNEKNSTVAVSQANGVTTSVAAASSNDVWSNVIDAASMAFLQKAVISDSDIVMLTALGEALVRESGVVAVSSDLTIAQDYETYLANSDVINAMIEANPESSFATGWELTLLEAEGLGVTNVVAEPGWTGTLSNNVEDVYDANGGLVEEIVFNSDGTQSIEALPLTTISANGQTIALAADTAYEIVGSNNRVTLSADDHVYLSGTGGSGGTNGDTVLFDKGDGQTTLESDTGGVLALGADIAPDDLTFSSDAQGDLIIGLKDASDTVTIQNELAENSSGASIVLPQIEFSDGALLPIYRAGPGTVTVTADDGGGVMLAGEGDDTFNVGDLADSGTTNIVYGSFNGDLTINADVNYFHSISNVLELSDLNASDVTFSRDQSNDLVITVNSTGNTITVNGEFDSATNEGVQTIQFADGTVWDWDQIETAAWYRAGSGDVTLTAADTGGIVPTMLAGEGDDTFNVGDLADSGTTNIVYGSLDGDLTINADVNYFHSISNVLELSDLNASDVTFSRDQSNDLVITVNSTGNTITVNGEFDSATNEGVQTIQFADGTVWDWDQIETAAWYRAGSGDVTLTAADTGGIVPTMLAGEGDDVFNVGDLADSGTTNIIYSSLDGELTINADVNYFHSISNVLELSDLNASDVTFSRDQSNDLVITVNSTGNTITVNGEFDSATNEGVQTIQFADGTVWDWDQIETAAWYRAGSGDVTLTAADTGGIVPTMLAGEGDDTFNVGDLADSGTTNIIYSSLDGELTINADVNYFHSISNVLELSDLNASDVTFSRDQSNDLVITVNSTGNTITVNGEFDSATNEGVQTIQFADGTVWDWDQIETAAWYRAGSGDVTLTAADTGGIVPTMLAGEGDDTFNVGDLADSGTTNIVYGSLDGDLTINADVNYFHSISNVLELSDLNASDVTFSRDQSNDLVITVNSTGNTITVNGEFDSATNEGVQTIQFADGTVWDWDQIETAAWYRAGSGDVTLTAADTGGIVPTMLAGEGDDTFNVGDLADSGTTNIVYGSLDGDLTINADVNYFHSISNVLELSDLNASDVTFSRDQSNDLVITVNSTGNTITVNGEFDSATHNGVQSVQFANGRVWNWSQIESAANGAPPDPGPAASAVTETIGHGQTVDLTPALLAAVTPGEPGDVISIAGVSGAQGAVSIDNGEVEYTAPASGVSADDFTYTAADQLGDQAVGDVDVTVDPGPTAGAVDETIDVGDSLDLTAAILAAATPGLPGDVLSITSVNVSGTIGALSFNNGDVTYTASAAAFSGLVANSSSADSFSYTISDQLGDTTSGEVELTVDNPVTLVSGSQYGGGTIQGVDGAEDITASGYSNTIDANGGSGTINAGEGSAIVNAGSGNLTINLGGYDDSVSGGDGTDVVSGSQGNATIALGNGDDSVTTGGYDNVITLGNGNDTVSAGAGNETITLGDGNNNVSAQGYDNVINAGNGNNVISAGAGNETITLGNGNNSVTAQGYGNDITLGAGTNTISAGDGSDTVTANGGDDIFTFNSWNDVAKLLLGDNATIYDNGGGLQVSVGSANSVVSVAGYDPQIWIDLLNPNISYASTTQVMSALTSDGHGGTLLPLAGGTGSVDFLNMTPAQLHASNFNIG